MKTLNDIFSIFKLNRSEVDRLSQEVREAAIDDGNSGEEKRVSSDTYWILVEISDRILRSSLDNADNMTLAFKAYEVFPHRYLFQHAIFREATREKDVLNDRMPRELVWKQLVKCLSSENYHADPIKRMLREYYFEDEESVKETWQGLMNANPNRIAMLRILDVSASVPWESKEPVYYSLLDDKANHSAIVDSIYKSAFVEGGKINKKNAFNLLKRLSIDPRSLDYRNLLNEIKPKPLPQPASFGKPDNAFRHI